jgi:Flagellar assembly protein T, middle domain
MGGIRWPSVRNLPCLLFLIFLATPCLSYQIIPDDIAFKPSPKESAVTTNDTASTNEPVSPELEAGTVSYSEQNLSAENKPGETPEEEQNKKEAYSCESQNQWQKTLTIAAMPRLNPNGSNAGNFFAAETEIPKLLAKELKKSIGIESRFIQQMSNPTLSADQKRQITQQIASRESTQFVLSGEILDMSMRDPGSVYSPDFLQTLRNHFTDFTMMKFTDTRDRVFGLRLELRDGFTGEVLLEDHFYTKGIWKNPKPIGFTSPDVWRSEYGRRIQQLVSKAGKQLAQNLQCQPYMARIESIPGQTELLIQGGANNGLHPGDQMNLYQFIVLASPSQYETYQTRLVKRDLQLRVKEVYPSHSLALLEGDDLLNGQYLAVGAESKSF